MPPPKAMPEAAASFFQALTDTRFMLPLIGGVQLISGLMILTGIMVPLGLTLLAPVVVDIVLYHHYVDPTGLGIAYVVLALELFLAYAYGPLSAASSIRARSHAGTRTRQAPVGRVFRMTMTTSIMNHDV